MTGDQFRRLRESVGTQEEVAKELEVNVRTLRRWESGETRVPKVAQLAIRYLTGR